VIFCFNHCYWGVKMSSLLSSLGCCFWWFIAGTLLGWLLNKWLCKCCCKTPSSSDNTTQAKAVEMPPTTVSTPIVKEPEPPKADAPLMAVPVAAVKPKAPTKPKATKPKVAPKAKASGIDIAAAKKAGFTIKNADDLTVIEGIGPKINDLFKTAGLKTFTQVAKASIPQMRKILDDGGPRFRIANPSTWAQQAGLAAANKWTELKKLQDELSAGLKK
jgi:predicted flap endonuclease-1-like 5' DNA nuclease